MNGIPDPGGVSGTFAALDRHKPVDEPMTFAFGDHVIRAVVLSDDPWFVVTDICRAIEISNVGNATDRLRRSGAGVRQTDIRSAGQTRAVTIVDESGLYELIIRSDKPEANRFRRWITSEVLPAIRKTGSYSRYPAHAAHTALPSKKELAQWVIAAEERAEAAEQLARELTPPAAAYQELVDADGDYSVADAAKVLSRDPSIDIRERRLFEFMANEGWVFRRGGRWKAYSTAVQTGRLAEKAARPFWSAARERMVNADPTVRVTPKGLMDLRARLCSPAAGTQLALVVDQ